MEEKEVVNEVPVTEETVVEETTQVEPGEKTDSTLLLKSLKEEREKRRLLEEELLKLNKSQEAEVFSDEGLALQRQIKELEGVIEKKEIIEKFPELKDKQDEFEQFRKDYPGVSVEKTAKLFLSENDLIEKPRKGLEKVSGGMRTPQQTGLSSEEISKLRSTNFRKYSQLVREGKIKF